MSLTPEFCAAFEGVGAPHITCACGLVNYAVDAEGISDLLVRGKDVAHEGDAVHAKIIGGVAYVVGCKCGFFERFEALLWHDRHPIARYLRDRSQREAAAALGMVTALDKALSPDEYARLNPEQPPLEGGKHYADCGESPVGVTCNRPDCRYCATNVFE